MRCMQCGKGKMVERFGPIEADYRDELFTIEFTATVARVKTMADGGLRFEFDAGEAETLAAVQLMECKRFGAVLKVVIDPVEPENWTELDDETEKGTEGSGTGVDRRRRANRRDQRAGG